MAGNTHVEEGEIRAFSQATFKAVEALDTNPTMMAGTDAASSQTERYSAEYAGRINNEAAQFGENIQWTVLPAAKTFWDGNHQYRANDLARFINDAKLSIQVISIAAGGAVVRYETTDDVSASDITNSAFVPNEVLREGTVGRYMWDNNPQNKDVEFPDHDNDGILNSNDDDYAPPQEPPN